MSDEARLVHKLLAQQLIVENTGKTCHCDGPPHPWSYGWCPVTGPETGRR